MLIPSRSKLLTTNDRHASSSRIAGCAFSGPSPSLPDGMSAPSAIPALGTIQGAAELHQHRKAAGVRNAVFGLDLIP